WIAPVQRRPFPAELRERIRNSGASWPWPWTAQDRPLQRRDGAVLPSLGLTQAEQRVFEDSKERHRRQAAENCFRDQLRKATRGRVDERVAAGIVHGDLPTLERRNHPARQRPVRGRERRCFIRVLQTFA